MCAIRSISSPAVRVESLIPFQHRAQRQFRIAADVRVQHMVKHPHVSEFHSLAEHLHAGLLEGTPSVTVYVPQPFALRIGKRRYTPDFYVVDGDQRRVEELKPRGEFDEALWRPLEAFFAAQGMRFEVVSNESVFARIIEAQNWLTIVQALHLSRDLDTVATETKVMRIVEAQSFITVADLVDLGDREGTLNQEIALFRLLHRGVLKAALENEPLDFKTRVAAS